MHGLPGPRHAAGDAVCTYAHACASLAAGGLGTGLAARSTCCGLCVAPSVAWDTRGLCCKWSRRVPVNVSHAVGRSTCVALGPWGSSCGTAVGLLTDVQQAHTQAACYL